MPVNTAQLGTGGGPNTPQGLTGTGSMVTLANATGFTQGQIGLILNASGLSLAWSSGASIYYFGGSTVSAVQA